MSIEVLGVSGSPVKNSNTDTLIKAVLKSTGAETKFVKLSEIKVRPCIACRKCAYTNKCVLDDDFRWLSRDIREAKAVVIGTPVMYSAASAYTKAFIERHYSLRHVKLLTQGKIGATVVVGELRADEVSRWLAGFMMSAGMELAGSMSAFGDPGCFNCGPGETCSYSIWNSMAKREGLDNFYMKAYAGYLEALPDNDPSKNPSYKILKHRSVKDEPEVMAKAEAIGREIRRRLTAKKSN